MDLNINNVKICNRVIPRKIGGRLADFQKIVDIYVQMENGQVLISIEGK